MDVSDVCNNALSRTLETRDLNNDIKRTVELFHLELVIATFGGEFDHAVSAGRRVVGVNRAHQASMACLHGV